MATTTQPAAAQGARREVRTGYPASTARFDWLMAGLSALFLGGLWVDGWAHFHGKVDSSFFTVWHLVFYSAFALTALTLGVRQWRGIGAGYAFSRALPKGYGLSLVGAVLFGLGGVGDMVWHELFGIEGGTEALLSPTHILLGIGMGLIFTGPARSAWVRARSGEALTGWRDLGPLLVSTCVFLTLLMFFTSYAHPLSNPIAHRLNRGGDAQDFGVTAILLEAGILAGVLCVLWARWRLPVGAVALLAFVSAGMVTILVDSYPFLPSLAIVLVIAEIALRWLQPTTARPAALVPALVYLSYFV